jgi:lysophospholipase L1-like esterase
MLMRLKRFAPVFACALMCFVPAIALAKHPKQPVPSYYVALGDSLAAGAQPDAAGHTVPTSNGYANFLYATEKSKFKGLMLKDLGCLGESTSSMIAGGHFCRYAGAQLADAVKFIKAHKIAFVTLDIGANDVDGCATGLSINGPCLTSGIASIKSNVPKIVSALRKAVGPKVKIIGMTYYDPFLADYLMSPAGQGIAKLSQGLAKNVNDGLVGAFKDQHVQVADVATYVSTYTPFTQTASLRGHGKVPIAVWEICTLTWMCAAPPLGPNIHANTMGYHAIANVFAAKL